MPTLIDAADGYGDWVAVNFSLLTGAGLTGGAGASFKKALDRIVGNSLALFFVLTVIDVGGVDSVNAIIGSVRYYITDESVWSVRNVLPATLSGA